MILFIDNGWYGDNREFHFVNLPPTRSLTPGDVIALYQYDLRNLNAVLVARINSIQWCVSGAQAKTLKTFFDGWDPMETVKEHPKYRTLCLLIGRQVEP